MINPCTLLIKGVAVPPEMEQKLRTQASALWLCALVYTVLHELAVIIYIYLAKSSEYSDFNVSLSLPLYSAAAGVLLFGWLLCTKFNVHTSGISVGLMFLAIVLEFEAIVFCNMDYSNTAVSRMLMCNISCLVIAMSERNFVVAAAGGSSIYVYAVIRMKNVYDADEYSDYALALIVNIVSIYTVIWIRKKVILDEVLSRIESRNWKSLLMLLSDAVLVSDSSKLLFSNKAFQRILLEIDCEPAKGADINVSKRNETVATLTETRLEEANKFMESYVLKDNNGLIYKNLGLMELVRRKIEGEFVMTRQETDTNVKYYLNCKSINFNDTEATLFLIRDSTDAEKAYRKMVEEKYRGMLLSTITHELKTPLTIIQGNLELVRAQVVPEIRPQFDAAMLASKSLKYYLHDIDDIRRLVEGKLVTKKEKVNLYSVFARLKEFLTLRTQLKSLRLTVQLKDSVPRHVLTDKRHLMQILLNVAYNAIKYTFEGEVRITGWMKDQATFAIEVSDTGVGIEPQLLKNIFCIFGLIDKKVNAHETGIGVGLYLCKRLVNELGGKIELQSEVKKGTKCLIELPAPTCTPCDDLPTTKIDEIPDMLLPPKVSTTVIESPDSESYRTPRPPTPKKKTKHYLRQSTSPQIVNVHVKSRIGKMRVMVVDDDPLALMAISGMLKHVGCEVATAPNGAVALDEVTRRNQVGKEEPFELVLMDANMPVMNGYESAKVITLLVEEGRITPVKVVCLSAQDSGEHAELCKKSGMSYIMEKPCSVHSLKEMLRFYGYDQ